MCPAIAATAKVGHAQRGHARLSARYGGVRTMLIDAFQLDDNRGIIAAFAALITEAPRARRTQKGDGPIAVTSNQKCDDT